MNNVTPINARERIESDRLETKIKRLYWNILAIPEIGNLDDESRFSGYMRELHSLRVDYLLIGKKFAKTKSERERRETL